VEDIPQKCHVKDRTPPISTAPLDSFENCFLINKLLNKFETKVFNVSG